MLFGRKTNPQVDMGDLNEEKENLSSFLQTKLKAKVTAKENKLHLDSEEVSPLELERIVSKFIYHRNLNGTHYASLEGSTVKITSFKGVDKKPKKSKSNSPHQTAAQSWGL